MKSILLPFAGIVAFAFAGGLDASAQIVTAINQTSGDTLPGQGGTTDPDYTFFGAFRPGGGNGPQTLTDFTQIQNGFNGDDGPTVHAPAGSVDSGNNPITTVTPASVVVGQQFFNVNTVDLVDFDVLGTAGSAYNLSAMFGVIPTSAIDNTKDQSITVVITNGPTGFTPGPFNSQIPIYGPALSSATLNVTDNNTSSTNGLYANFFLSGLSAGEVIHLEAAPALFTDNVQTAYVLAAGFTPVATPEPSTYALLIGGMLLLVVVVRTSKNSGGGTAQCF